MSYFHWITGGILGWSGFGVWWRPRWACRRSRTFRFPSGTALPARQSASQHHRSCLQRRSGYRSHARLDCSLSITPNMRSSPSTIDPPIAPEKSWNEVAVARRAGRLKVIHVTELPPGWMGKPHAMWSAGKRRPATGCCLPMPMFCSSPMLSGAPLAYAETEPADHIVLFPRMIMKRPGEKMMIAFFQTLFVFGHRPWKVADPKTKDHIGVGAFNMIRRQVYEAVGTYRGVAFRSARRHETGQGGEERRLRATQRFWRRPDFHSLGERRDGRGGQSHQEFLRHHVIPVAEGAGFLLCAGVPEPDAVCRSCFWRTAGRGWGTPLLCSRCFPFTWECPPSPIFRRTTSCCIRSARCCSFTPCCDRHS